MLQTVETEHGPIKVVGSGFRLEHGGGSVERPPATLGEHTDEMLGEAGYSAAEIAEMRDGEGRLIDPARRRSPNRELPDLPVVPSEAEGPPRQAAGSIEQAPCQGSASLPVGTTEFVQGHPADVQPSKLRRKPSSLASNSV